MTVQIIVGDVRDKLREIPDESVHCCVTSPPYFGLRSYGTPPQIWGGNDPACAHHWGDATVRDARHLPEGDPSEKQATNAGSHQRGIKPGEFCSYCGAWRGELGLEPTVDLYVEHLVAVFREVRRVLRPDGTLWLNIGDSYAGSWGAQSRRIVESDDPSWHSSQIKNHPKRASHTGALRSAGVKPKDLYGVPWLIAFALRADGWWLRQDIIWSKPNPMPESVQGSHFSRHMVTIADYERLSGLPYVDERAGDDWAGDMPSLSEVEISGGKATLPAQRQRKGDSARARGSARRNGEAPSGGGIRNGATQQRHISPNGEGQSQREKTGSGLPGQAGRSGRDHHRAGLARHIGAAQPPLLLLQEADIENDAGSRHPLEQGRPELAGERCAGMSLVQQQEEGQADPDRLVGCPGCDKCASLHGYLFHMSAGRCTKAHEYLFLLSKSERYYYDADAIAEPFANASIERLRQDLANQRGSDRVPGKTNGRMKAVGLNINRSSYKPGSASNMNDREHVKKSDAGLPLNETGRNKRSVWEVATQPFSLAHFATFPPALIEPCILAGCPVGGTVLDPFFGAGTTGLVADRLGRNCIGIELNPEYAEMARRRVERDAGMFAEVALEAERDHDRHPDADNDAIRDA